MRKIEQDMLTALRYERDFHRDNTDVKWGINPDNDEAEAHVYLHGNLIARYTPGASELYLSDAGWQTVTTKSRLNALLELVPVRATIHQHDWEWYLSIAAVRQ